MPFVIIGRDGTDEQALARRMSVRQAHLDNAKKQVESGNLLYGFGLKENDQLIGSVMVFNFNTEAEVAEYLKTEPYVAGNVWQDIEIKAVAIPEFFAKI